LHPYIKVSSLRLNPKVALCFGQRLNQGTEPADSEIGCSGDSGQLDMGTVGSSITARIEDRDFLAKGIQERMEISLRENIEVNVEETSVCGSFHTMTVINKVAVCNSR